MYKKIGILALALALIAAGLSAASLILAAKPAEEKTADIQYVLYLGTNDKDTNEPVCAPEEAKEKA